MKVISIVGARPQFIKLLPIIRELEKFNKFENIILHTGQHYDNNLSEVFFDELGIPNPDYNLSIGSGTHATQTGKMMVAIEAVLLKENPCCVIVYGDTNSTLAGALVAVKLNIPVAHVEAGLRSFNTNMPEEINRVVTDRISSILFAPTNIAVDNLAREGVNTDSIFLVGDVMYDAILQYKQLSNDKSKILSELNLIENEFVLVTIHRAESTDSEENLRAIFKSIGELATVVKVIMPIHPRTRKKVRNLINVDGIDKIQLIDPVGYLDVIQLEQKAKAIITDSGGVQKEAYFCKTPCLTIRSETEWVELVEAGWNRLIPIESLMQNSKILVELINDNVQFSSQESLYGNGNSAKLIVGTLLQKFS